MLFDSSVRRDLARTFAATMVVILTIVITIFLIRTLGQAAGGAVAPQDVVLLLGFAASAHLATMMCLSMFVAVVITLGRMYRDSEMVIWFASGIGLPRFVRPVLWTALPVVRTFDKLLAAALAVLENGQRTNNEPQAVDPMLVSRTSLASACARFTVCEAPA